jgi:hypothetical protein
VFLADGLPITYSCLLTANRYEMSENSVRRCQDEFRAVVEAGDLSVRQCDARIEDEDPNVFPELSPTNSHSWRTEIHFLVWAGSVNSS